MKRWVLAIVILFIAVLVSCESTVTEPGEPEHGGPFLHASPDLATTR